VTKRDPAGDETAGAAGATVEGMVGCRVADISVPPGRSVAR
jgi:hypothetical protein